MVPLCLTCDALVVSTTPGTLKTLAGVAIIFFSVGKHLMLGNYVAVSAPLTAH